MSEPDVLKVRLLRDGAKLPWRATPLELADAGVELGRTYPEPNIDHKKGRERALDAYAKVRAA